MHKAITIGLKTCIIVFLVCFLGVFVINFLDSWIINVCADMGGRGSEFFCDNLSGVPGPRGITEILPYITPFQGITMMLRELFTIIWPIALIGVILFFGFYLINKNRDIKYIVKRIVFWASLFFISFLSYLFILMRELTTPFHYGFCMDCPEINPLYAINLIASIITSALLLISIISFIMLSTYIISYFVNRKQNNIIK